MLGVEEYKNAAGECQAGKPSTRMRRHLSANAALAGLNETTSRSSGGRQFGSSTLKLQTRPMYERKCWVHLDRSVR
jgi:hypothetical protein